jgi:hypothetical protein
VARGRTAKLYLAGDVAIRPSAMGAHYRHTTPEMAMRAIDAIDRRLTVVLGVAEQALERYPNRLAPRVF